MARPRNRPHSGSRRASSLPDPKRRTARAAREYPALVGLPGGAADSVHEHVLAGVPYSAFGRLQEWLDLSAQELGELVHISVRTLARRKGRRLQVEESDRVLRTARVAGLALDLFEGDQAGARRWLKSPKRALGRRTPLEAAMTDAGARQVEDLIGRLEHGVFS